MNVLIVEDEKRVLQFLEASLKQEGYCVFGCSTYESALDVLSAKNPIPDVIILDRQLHRNDGTSLVKPFRETFPGCKLIILSAINAPEEKASLLDLGADDYISKPFSLVELTARVRVLSRRKSSDADTGARGVPLYRLKDVELDPIQHTVTVNAKRVDLSNKEYQVLATFLKAPGRVYNKFQLLDLVWNMQFDIESNVVEVTVKNLRRKLELASSQLEIQSKRNIGYWVEA